MTCCVGFDPHHQNAYDEAVTTPTEESVRRAMAIQMIVNNESGWTKCENPLQGSFLTDELTDLVLSETDQDKRNDYIREAYQILHDERGYIPLHQQALAWGKRSNISLVQRADNQFMLNYVKVD